jgi:hypothetical protein
MGGGVDDTGVVVARMSPYVELDLRRPKKKKNSLLFVSFE